MRWYIKGSTGNQTLTTRHDILKAIQDGETPPDTLVWKPGNREWRAAYLRDEFRELVPPPRPAEALSQVSFGEDNAAPVDAIGPDFGEGMFNPSTPIGRGQFTACWLIPSAIAALNAWVIPRSSSAFTTPHIGAMVALGLLIVAQLIVAIKRLRDMRAPLWWVASLLLPLAGPILFIVLVFGPGAITRTPVAVGRVVDASTPTLSTRLGSYKLQTTPSDPMWLLLPVITLAGTWALSLGDEGGAGALLILIPWAVLPCLPAAIFEPSEARINRTGAQLSSKLR